mmetsp:Transcript_24630/g.37209  ORF Transcript_24630/g.37209 Transcript_24630/m.37209 type:complete len:330 (-) Transcript_24630:92-1081(-)
MNHLCDLNDITTLSDISTDDASILKSFRTDYNSHKSNDKDNSDRPLWIIPPDHVTEWRPLDDVTLHRFLRADVQNGICQPEKSLDRILRAMEFRHKNRADALLRAMTTQTKKRKVSLVSGNWSQCGSMVKIMQSNQDSSDIAMLLPGLDKYQRLRIRVFTGRSHTGEPVLFERLGEFLGSGNHAHFSEEEWIRFYIWDLERHFIEMREAAQLSGNPITQYVFLGDGHGIVTAILNRRIWGVIPLLKALAKSVEEFYPEIAARIILFRVPKVATMFYRAVRAFLDPVTASKISLCSGVPIEEFLKIMPLDAIPAEYGGTCQVPYPPSAKK